MITEVTSFIKETPKEQREILEAIRNLIHECVPDVEEQFKWGRPVFRKKKDFAYMAAAGNYITLGFFNFRNLRDVNHKLEGTGNEMRHVKIKKLTHVDHRLLKEWINEAAK